MAAGLGFFHNLQFYYIVVVVLISLNDWNSVAAGKDNKWKLENYQHYQQHRLKTGGSNMFISMYEHENFRGKVHQQTIARSCINVQQEYNDWASSVLLHDHCVTLCDELDCKGRCRSFYPNEKGMGRLTQYDLNDKVSSVKYCYHFR